MTCCTRTPRSRSRHTGARPRPPGSQPPAATAAFAGSPRPRAPRSYPTPLKTPLTTRAHVRTHARTHTVLAACAGCCRSCGGATLSLSWLATRRAPTPAGPTSAATRAPPGRCSSREGASASAPEARGPALPPCPPKPRPGRITGRNQSQATCPPTTHIYHPTHTATQHTLPPNTHTHSPAAPAPLLPAAATATASPRATCSCRT